MKLPWVSRKYAERLETENARLIEENRRLIDAAFAASRLPRPFEPRKNPAMFRAPGRMTVEELGRRLEAQEREPA